MHVKVHFTAQMKKISRQSSTGMEIKLNTADFTQGLTSKMYSLQALP